eukprot:jgi/Psemu1/45441/gm1.45441_g
MSANDSLPSQRAVLVDPSVFLDKVQTAVAEFFPSNLSILFPQEETLPSSKIWYCDFKLTVKKYFPHLPPTSPSYNALAMVVCPKENHKYTWKHRKDAVIKAQQVMMSIFPSLGLFGILYRWSRVAKRKTRFLQDAFNCAIDLQKNTDCTSMVKGSTVKYVKASALPLGISDSLVTKLEGSLSIIYHLVGNAESGTMHMVWQKTVLSNHEFPIDNGDLTIEDCFKRHIWFCLQHIHLGFVLYEIIYKFVLLSKEVYKNNTANTATMQPLVPLLDIHHEEPSLSNLSPNVPPLVIEQVSLDVIVSSPAAISSSLPDLSFHELTTGSNLQHWDSLKLAPLQCHQDRQVRSCLYICAREHIHEMAFSNPDFYSASGLVNHEHWRSISCEGADVMDELSGLNLIRIPSAVLQRLDPLNILDVVQPGSPVYQRCQVHYKANLLKLFHFVLFHGKSPAGTDLRRTKDNRSVEIGTHFGTDIIHNTHKFDALGEDSAMVKATVAQLMDFLWYVAQDVQITAKRCPLTGHVCRDNRFGIPFQNVMGAKSSLFHCVTLVVLLVYPYACQGKRHRDMLNDSTYAYCQIVVGNWYFQDGEGSIYLLQMLCNFHGSASSLFLHKVTMIALGLPDSGMHLLQLNIPSKGTASFDHFLNPTKKDIGNGGVEPIPVGNSDTMYLRTCMETLGCESAGHRDLNIKDVFIKDGILFEIDQQNGIPIHKMPE